MEIFPLDTFSLSLEDRFRAPQPLFDSADAADLDSAVISSNVAHEALIGNDGRHGRFEFAQGLQDAIQEYRPEFRMRVEHVITVLLTSKRRLEPGGRLSPEPPTINWPSMLELRLETIAPFCKHYMLHLDPKNLDLPEWAHALPQPLEPQPEVNDELLQHDAETIEKAIIFSARFRTLPTLESVTRDTKQEAECRERDGNKCVVTGKDNPLVFWIIPMTWNDTVEHNNATGDLKTGGVDLAGINLSRGPVAVCKSGALGESHKAWNMLCIDPALYDCLVQGRCAFRYLDNSDLPGGKSVALLQFYWMPQMKRRFGKDMDVKDLSQSNPTRRLLHELDDFHKKGYPPPASHKDKLTDKKGGMIRTGRLFRVILPSEDIEKFKTVVELQWACIVFTALCGAAGRPWELCGEKDEDPDEGN